MAHTSQAVLSTIPFLDMFFIFLYTGTELARENTRPETLSSSMDSSRANCPRGRFKRAISRCRKGKVPSNVMPQADTVAMASMMGDMPGIRVTPVRYSKAAAMRPIYVRAVISLPTNRQQRMVW